MITCNLVGGLGNQLFQIFAIIAYSIRSRNPFVFPYHKFSENVPNRPTYWDTFLIALRKYTNYTQIITNDTLSTFEPYYCPNDYLEISSSNENILFHQYFQSHLYFRNEYSQIYQLLDIDAQKSLVEDIQTEYPTISLHFRLGDYVTKQCYHPVLSLIYYERAINHIIDTVSSDLRPQVLVFFEECDANYVANSIQILSEKIPTVDFRIMEPDEDWKQLMLISKCKHHIIANSTFSWWGAIFSRNVIDETATDKIVCYPSIWYGHQLYYINVEKLFLKHWTKIDADEMPPCNCFL